MIRLDKYLADMGIGTRSEVKNIIRKKQVSVNGMPISKPEAKVDITKDTVCYQGKPVAYEPYVYYMLNKPGGYVSAVKDNLYPTVLLLKIQRAITCFRSAGWILTRKDSC
jgi:16S rRNA pseudouridine516 synthase